MLLWCFLAVCGMLGLVMGTFWSANVGISYKMSWPFLLVLSVGCWGRIIDPRSIAERDWGTGHRVAPSLEFGGVGSPEFTVVYTTIPNFTEVDSSGPNLRLVIGNYCIGQLIPQKWDLETQMIVVSKCSILLSSMWIDYIISSVMGFPSIFGIYRVRFGRSQI
jgi:hypothetical protein